MQLLFHLLDIKQILSFLVLLLEMSDLLAFQLSLLVRLLLWPYFLGGEFPVVLLQEHDLLKKGYFGRLVVVQGLLDRSDGLAAERVLG